MTQQELIEKFETAIGFTAALGLTDAYMRYSKEAFAEAAKNKQLSFVQFDFGTGKIIVAKIGEDFFKGGMYIPKHDDLYSFDSADEFQSYFTDFENPQTIA